MKRNTNACDQIPITVDWITHSKQHQIREISVQHVTIVTKLTILSQPHSANWKLDSEASANRFSCKPELTRAACGLLFYRSVIKLIQMGPTFGVHLGVYGFAKVYNTSNDRAYNPCQRRN